MNATHTVGLPHPPRTGEDIVGTCTCGWEISYGWGGHGAASDAAEEHVRQEERAEPVAHRHGSGHITVFGGLSL